MKANLNQMESALPLKGTKLLLFARKNSIFKRRRKLRRIGFSPASWRDRNIKFLLSQGKLSAFKFNLFKQILVSLIVITTLSIVHQQQLDFKRTEILSFSSKAYSGIGLVEASNAFISYEESPKFESNRKSKFRAPVEQNDTQLSKNQLTPPLGSERQDAVESELKMRLELKSRLELKLNLNLNEIDKAVSPLLLNESELDAKLPGAASYLPTAHGDSPAMADGKLIDWREKKNIVAPNNDNNNGHQPLMQFQRDNQSANRSNSNFLAQTTDAGAGEGREARSPAARRPERHARNSPPSLASDAKLTRLKRHSVDKEANVGRSQQQALPERAPMNQFERQRKLRSNQPRSSPKRLRRPLASATRNDDLLDDAIDESSIIKQQFGQLNLIDLQDNELFLAPGSPNGPMPLPSDILNFDQSGDRSKRSWLEQSSQPQTIYFGGFFPWLSDEDTKQTNSKFPAPEASRQRRVRDGQAARTDSAASPEVQPQAASFNNLSSEAATAAATSTTTSKSSSHSANSYLTSSENRHQLGRFILPAVRLALDHINGNRSVLNNYRLEIVPRDTQCNATISLKEFFDMVYEEPKKMLLYGDACRVSTDPIAKASYFFDLIQISYADTDPIYTIENYPNFFRVVPSENALSLARIPFIRHFNWTRVGTIYQNLPRYSLPHSKLLTDLERFNIVIKQSVSLPGSVDGHRNRDLGDELRKLKEKDVRIILGNFDEEWALLLFCEAFREKMTGRKYQWILTGISEDKLWLHHKLKGSTCSDQELIVAMDGYITTDITTVTRSQQPTISGLMAHEFSNEYRKRAQEMNIAIEENKFYGYVYDGIWAIALALHRVDYQLRYYNQLAQSGRAKLNPELAGLSSLMDFDYHRPIWVKLIRNALNRTRFGGVTAIRNNSEVIIGDYNALNDYLNLKVGFPIIWRGSSPPIDYTIQRVTPFRINRTLFVVISILALFGILLAIIFLTINIKFRNQRYIKMSSPYLNNLIIIGCILTYTSVIILGLDSGLTSEYNFPYICNARAWVLMAGFTLAFGSMFSKTFRVHSIFTNIKLHKKVIKDYKLFMVVFILLTFDVCILIVWQYFDPFYRETNNGTSIQDLYDEDVIIVPEMEHCQSKRMTIFLSVIYVYKGLLMAFGCFLAWETRHVSIPALNDSKYIGLSVYNVVIMCVIGASLSFVLRDQQDASFVIISIFIIFCSTTTLCLVFVPKLIELKQNPRAGEHRVRATLKTFKKNYHEEAFGAAAAAATCRDIHGNIIHGRGIYNLSERIKLIADENLKQRALLKEKTYELEALTYKYRKIQGMIQSGQSLQAVNLAGANKANLPNSSSGSLLASSGMAGTPLTAAVAQAHKTGPSLPPQNQLRAAQRVRGHEDRVSFGGALKREAAPIERAGEGSDDEKAGKFLPRTSSITQLTTTNTTSSSQNQTESTTNELSSTYNKSTSNANLRKSPTEQQGNSPAPTSNKKHTSFASIQDQKANGQEQMAPNSAPSSSQITTSAKQAKTNFPCCLKDNIYSKKTKQLPAAVGDQRKDLFTIFSYTNENSISNNNCSSDAKGESKFSRWSKGPFCTLMVKNVSGNRNCLPGRAVLKRALPEEDSIVGGAEVGALSSTSARQLDIGASCPDIASKFNESGKIKQQQLRQTAEKSLFPPAGIDENQRKLSSSLQRIKRRSKLTASNSSAQSLNKLPRTISMIEYLGMKEFDLIARRHDKLSLNRDDKTPAGGGAKKSLQYSSCNQQLEQQQQSIGANCSICAYCEHRKLFKKANQNRLQNNCKSTVNQEGVVVVCSDDGTNNNNSISEQIYSQNDFLMHSGSIISCSTCCSFSSSMEQSELLFEHQLHNQATSGGPCSADQVSQSSQSISQSNSLMSTITTSSSISDEFLPNNHNKQSTTFPLSNCQSSSSSSLVENTDRHQHHHRHNNCHHHHIAILCQHHQQVEQQKNSALHRRVEASHSKSNDALMLDSLAEQPLYTSGSLQVSPAAKEDANGSIGLIGHQAMGGARTRCGGHESESTESDEEDKFPIKCDVVENL